MNFATALLVLAGVGAAAVGLLWHLNRRPVELSTAAKRELLERAQARSDADVASFISACGVAVDQVPEASRVLQAVASILQVPPSKIAFNIPLADLLSVPPSHLDAQRQEPFAYELVERIGELCDKEKLASYLATAIGRINDEDSFASHMMKMSVPELVRTFTPLAARV
jgi:hypothetical protein